MEDTMAEPQQPSLEQAASVMIPEPAPAGLVGQAHPHALMRMPRGLALAAGKPPRSSLIY